MSWGSDLVSGVEDVGNEIGGAVSSGAEQTGQAIGQGWSNLGATGSALTDPFSQVIAGAGPLGQLFNALPPQLRGVQLLTLLGTGGMAYAPALLALMASNLGPMGAQLVAPALRQYAQLAQLWQTRGGSALNHHVPPRRHRVPRGRVARY